VRLLRKYYVWVLICMLACVAGASVIGAARSVQYTSTASVDVEAATLPGGTPAVVNTSTEKDVASSGIVLANAARQIGESPTTLAKNISVTVPSGANVLAIACTMPQPAAAQRCAHAVSQSYMNFRNDVGQPKSVANRDPWNVTLVTPAALPTKPSGLPLSVLLSLGAVIGLLLGTGTAYIRDRADDRVRDREDLENCLGEPVLAVVPRSRDAMQAATVFSSAPGSRAAEAFRYLRTHIDPLVPADPAGGKVVLVSGAQRREGRSSVAANLAAAMAHAGRKVLLVDADLRNPFLADVFAAAVSGTANKAGLTEVLSGEASAADVTVPTGRPRLQLITAGRQVGGTADMVNATSLERAIAQMRAEADVIIVDGGPALDVADAITIAQHADLVVHVANVRRTLRSAIRNAAQELRTSSGGVNLVGVLTGVPGQITIGRPAPVPQAAPTATTPYREPARTARATAEVTARTSQAATAIGPSQ
jgi:capsular exopolysaccharide synthesis family protein